MASDKTEDKSKGPQRGNLYGDNPMNIGIIGGKVIEHEDERGPLDTDPDMGHELFSVAQETRLRTELDEPFWRGVDFNGVKVPITVKKYNGAPYCVVGRRRLRAARRANVERAKRGEPPMIIPYIIEQSNDKARLAGLVMLENSARLDDDIGSKVEQARSFMERYSCDVDTAAMYMNERSNVVKSWLSFDDGAIDEVKTAVYDGRMTISAGIEIARAKTPDAQLAAFQAALDANEDDADTETNGIGGKPKRISTRAARNAAKSVTKPDSNAAVDDKRTQKRVLQAMRDKSHGKAGEATLAFWEGCECMLAFVLGGEEATDAGNGFRGKTLGELIKEVRKAMKKGASK